MLSTASKHKIRMVVYTIALFLLLIMMLILASIPVNIISKPEDLPSANIPDIMVLKNANVIDVRTGQILSNRQIVIDAGRISKITSEPRSEDIPEIDLQGAYIAPGLVDMHVHVHDRRDMATNLAYGVTSVRNLRGFPAHLRWRDEINSQQWLGATMYVSSPVLDGPKYAHALQQVVTTTEQGRQLVNHYQDLGYDLIKVYGYLAPDIYAAIMTEATKIGMPVAKHGPSSPTENPYEWLDAVQSLEHVEDIFQGPLEYQFDDQLLANYIQNIKPIQPYITPTLATFAHLTYLSEDKQSFIDTIALQQINPFIKALYGKMTVERWLNATPEMADHNRRELQYLQHITKLLSDQGIPLLIGSDAGTMFITAGIATHMEMQLFQDANISPIKILRYATLNAAESMRLSHEIGVVEEGRWADFIITKDNPLNDISVLQHPLAVVKKGQYVNRQELNELIEIANNPDGFYIGMGLLFEDVLVRWWTDLTH